MLLEDYLKYLSEEPENESVGGFAIDSFPTKSNKRPLPVIYPESTDVDNLEPEIKLVKFDKKFYLSLPDRREISYHSSGEYYTIIYNGQKVGIVGFIPEHRRFHKEIGFAQIVIHPHFRGKQIVNTAYDLLMKRHKEVRKLYATILNKNIASQKAHIKAGFTRLPEEQQNHLRSLDWLDKDESRYVKHY